MRYDTQLEFMGLVVDLRNLMDGEWKKTPIAIDKPAQLVWRFRKINEAGIKTVGDVLEWDHFEVLKIPDVGASTIKAVMKIMREASEGIPSEVQYLRRRLAEVTARYREMERSKPISFGGGR